MATFDKLITGYRTFRATIHNKEKEVISHIIRQKIKPSTLFIACSDLRISPEVITSSNPGELYIIRNLACLLPPYQAPDALNDAQGANGTIASIEYAINSLKVENIIVLGHAHCDSIALLMSEDWENNTKASALKSWLSLGAPAKKVIQEQLKDRSSEDQKKACEQEIVLASLKNLLTYPFIQERIAQNNLDLYGWHIDMATGTLQSFNPRTRFFEPIG